MSRVTNRRRRSRVNPFRWVSGVVLARDHGLGVATLNPGMLYLPGWQTPPSDGDVEETPVYLGADAPQSVEYPTTEFAALAEPAPEAQAPRKDMVEYAIQDGDSLPSPKSMGCAQKPWCGPTISTTPT